MRSITKNQAKGKGQIIQLNSILVVIDCAKAEHVVQFLEPGRGVPLLKKALSISNNNDGQEKLLSLLSKTCKKHKLNYKDSTFVMEDPASYSRNLINQLQKKGFQVNYVNAKKCTDYRTNTRASSDELDLEGIAGAAMRGHMIDVQNNSQLYKQLTRSVRERAHLVKDQSAHKNIIHTYIDELFPGFLDHKLSGVEAFTEHCLALMLRSDFSVYSYAKKPLERLTTILHKIGFNTPAARAQQLKDLAKNALKPSLDYIDDMQDRLQLAVKLFQLRQECIIKEEQRMAKLLSQTGGFYLTSIPGVSIVLAAYIMAEYGNPLFWRSSDQMASYAGVVPRQKQSGGSDKAPVVLTLPIKQACNSPLRSSLFSAVLGIQKYEHPSIAVSGYKHDLKEHAENVENRGGKSRIACIKKFIRIMKVMVTNEDLYMPRKHEIAPQQLIAWIEIETQRMFKKWEAYNVYPSDDNKLGEWLRKKDKIIKVLTNT